MDELEQYRQKITDLTGEILDLFEARMALSEKVAAYKKAHGLPIHQPEREADLIRTLTQGRKDPKACQALLESLMTLSKKRQEQYLDG